MQYVIDKASTFISDHPHDEGTAITLLGRDCLILEDGDELAIVLLGPVDRQALAVALQAQNPPCSKVGPVWIGCGKLIISYTNRGEPYTSGVLLSLEDIAVFLEGSDIPHVVRLLQGTATASGNGNASSTCIL